MAKSTQLSEAQDRAGRIALMAGHMLAKTFSPRTIAKGREIAQSKADAKKHAQALKRRVRYALAHAERQQARALAKAQAQDSRDRIAWDHTTVTGTDARAVLRAEQAAGAQHEREVIARAREKFDRATNPTP